MSFMQFNSYVFVLCFLPLTVVVYYLANKLKPIAGKLVLIVASTVFYSFGRANMLIYLGISILINYTSALLIRKHRIRNKFFLALPIIVNTGLLFYFKYLNFLITNINTITGRTIEFKDMILPLGISFYTFQQIAYIVATERGELENSSLVDYLVYILFFPKLVMGPIIDPVDFISQLNQVNKKRADINNIAIGIKIFSLGLIKKALIADTFSNAVSSVYSNVDLATSMDCVLLMLFYTFEIYFDFSGYSDMAVGISSMFNIELPINFDSPYKALSIRDFWKRWHISLTQFLTKYIYIPLGGSKKGRVFTYMNVMIVFLISGLWHGANWTFILWGVLHGLFSCFDRLSFKWWEKVPVPIKWICTFVTVNVLWLLFSAQSVEQWMILLRKMLFMKDASISEGIMNSFNIIESQFAYDVLGLNYLPNNVRGFNMIIFVVSAFVVCLIPDNNFKRKDKLSIPSVVLASFAFVWGLLCMGAESTFVYFGF